MLKSMFINRSNRFVLSSLRTTSSNNPFMMRTFSTQVLGFPEDHPEPKHNRILVLHDLANLPGAKKKVILKL